MLYCRAKNKPVSFFGTSFAIVQTPSMEPYIMTGDLIVFHSCAYGDIEEGDYIVFVADDNFGKMKGQSIVHAVKEITEDGIVTQGLNNQKQDEGFREPSEILGICTFNSAGWGKVFSFIGKYGIFIIIILVFVPFAVKQIIKIVRLSKNKQAEEISAADDGGKEIAEPSEETDEKEITEPSEETDEKEK